MDDGRSLEDAGETQRGQREFTPCEKMASNLELLKKRVRKEESSVAVPGQCRMECRADVDGSGAGEGNVGEAACLLGDARAE